MNLSVNTNYSNNFRSKNISKNTPSFKAAYAKPDQLVELLDRFSNNRNPRIIASVKNVCMRVLETLVNASQQLRINRGLVLFPEKSAIWGDEIGLLRTDESSGDVLYGICAGLAGTKEPANIVSGMKHIEDNILPELLQITKSGNTTNKTLKLSAFTKLETREDVAKLDADLREIANKRLGLNISEQDWNHPPRTYWEQGFLGGRGDNAHLLDRHP